MRSNIKMLGWAHIIWHALGLVGGLTALVLFSLIGGAVEVAGGHEAHRVIPFFVVIGMAVFMITAVLSLPGLIIGWGLITFQPWARIGGIVLSALNLTAIPIGTALGIFGLITLCDPQAAAEFGP